MTLLAASGSHLDFLAAMDCNLELLFVSIFFHRTGKATDGGKGPYPVTGKQTMNMV